MLLKKLIYLSLVTFSATSSLAEAAPKSVIKIPYVVPIDKSSNLYTVFNKPVELGMCAAIKQAQMTQGQKDTDFTEYYLPVITKVLNKTTEIGKICGDDNTCYGKYVSENDAWILQGYGKATQHIKDKNISLYDLGIQALAYCGEAQTR